jgi:hypothetical protein
MMPWSSYALSDFLPFSLETYQRLGALYNAGFTLVVVIGLGLGLVGLFLLRRPSPWRLRLLLAGFALSWLWISWAYQLQTLAPLLWAGELFAIAFALQSGLLLAGAFWLPLPSATSPPGDARSLARAEGRTSVRIRARIRARISLGLGVGLLAVAILLLPLIELAAGSAWRGLSVFGTAPTPTAIGTLGLAALLGPRGAPLLMPIPLLWCLAASLLQLGLGDPLWPIPATATLVALAALGLGWQTGGLLRPASSQWDGDAGTRGRGAR